jgi:hypothetical protein
VATVATLAALGIEADSGATMAGEAPDADAPSYVRQRLRGTPAAHTAAPDDTKQARLIAMLNRTEGATIAQVVEATGWQPHTVRGRSPGR